MAGMEWKAPSYVPTLSPKSTANPNDPAQLSQWAAGVSKENAGKNLYDPDTMKQLTELFGPMFKQIQANYTSKAGGALNSQVGQAIQQAGAMAAFKGLNPASYTQSAARGVRQQMVPSYMAGLSDLLSGQQGTLLNATAQSNQFKSGNAQNYAQMLMGQAQLAQQNWERPTVWDYILGGLGGSLGSIGGAAINKWG